jgi:hypothetical protein
MVRAERSERDVTHDDDLSHTLVCGPFDGPQFDRARRNRKPVPHQLREAVGGLCHLRI